MIDQPIEVPHSCHYTQDMANLILRARRVFEEGVKVFKLSSKSKSLKVGTSQSDLIHGGECSVLELVFLTTSCIVKDQVLCQSLLPKLLPNNQPKFKSVEEEHEYLIQYAQMKICMSISKLGKNVRYMYDTLDVNNDGSLSPEEIVTGLIEFFHVYFSNEEVTRFCDYLDADKSGDIDFEEFSSKINYPLYNKNYPKYMITKTRFISIIIEEWKIHKERIYDRLIQIFKRFDDNRDGVLTYEEFETLVNNIEPNLSQQKISNLFNEVSAIS